MRHLGPGCLGREQSRGRRRLVRLARLGVSALALCAAASQPVQGQQLSTLTLSPASVVGGVPSTGTVTLTAAAGSNLQVALSSSKTSVATVLPSVTVPVGMTSATFTVTTIPVGLDDASTITATLGVAKTKVITVKTPSASSVTLSPTSVIGGVSSTGTVTLDGQAPSGGASVSLGSSLPAAATVPGSVIVPAGSTSTTFPITTLAVAADAQVTITATRGVAKTKVLTVKAASLTSITLNPSTVVGGTPSTGTVTLDGKAPTNGAVVGLTSSKTAVATVNSPVTVPAGSTSVTFPITTLTVTTNQTASITGTYAGATKSANLTVLPLLASVTLNQTSVIGGASPTATVTLNGPAPVGGVQMTLSSSNTSRATVPATVTVAAGWTVATFSVTTLVVTTTGSTSISATYAGASKSISLSVTPSVAAYSVVLNPAKAVGGSTSTGTLTLNGPAPAGGVVVPLSSSNGTVASVPATVAVPAGAVAAPFTVTTFPVANLASVTITATFGGSAPTAALSVTQFVEANTVSLSSTSLRGPGTSTATVTLDGPALSPGAVVILTSSDPTVATVPASVTVLTAAVSATFTVTALSVAAATSTTITAAYGGANAIATLAVTPAAALYSVTLSPATVAGGNPSTATVTLNGLAPTGGATVNLASSNTLVATVPASVVVPAGTATKVFTVTTLGVAASNDVLISGSYSGLTATATLVVTAAVPSSVSLNPTSVAGGSPSTGTVTLNGKAPAGGAVVALSSANPAVATVQATVMVAAGQLSKTFNVTTVWVGSTTTVAISATLLGVTQSANLTVTTTAAALSAVSVSPASVLGGGTSTGTATLTVPAPTGGATVTLSSSDPAATVPPGVTVLSGSSTATFTITTLGVSTSTPVTISGTYLGVMKSATLTVTPAVLSTLALSPTTVVGGNPSTGTVTITGPAPPLGSVVPLSSSVQTAATVPANVTVPGGALSATFTVTSLGVTTSSSTVITATYGGVPKTKTLTVNPATPSTVTLNPTTVIGGATSAGTVTLNGAAPPGGSTVALTSANPAAATVPASVPVAGGATTASFTATSLAVGTNTSSLITATFNGGSKNATLTVNAAVPSSMALNPASVVAGTSSQATVTLTGPAPSVGAVVDLTSSRTDVATVPPNVTVLAGATSASFTVTTLPVSTSTPVTISGAINGTSAGSTLTVTPCSVPVAPPPGSFPPDTVWLDDQLPPGATTSGVWTWDTVQKASGTQSNTEPPAAGIHTHSFGGSNPGFYVTATDKLVAYVLISSCEPPKEILLQWSADDGYEHRAFWGQDLIQWGTSGTASRLNMGALPAAGQWIRLEVPSSSLNLAGLNVYGLDFVLYDGQAWWDRIGKAATCTVSGVSPPPSFPPDLVWMDDQLPPGATTAGAWTWDTTQKASGTQSHTEPAGTWIREHGFGGANPPLFFNTDDKLVTYVLINPCDPPLEIMLQASADDGYEHRAFWGQDLVPWGNPGTPGHVNMGAMPATGQWVRLEIPASTLGLGGLNLYGVDYIAYDGKVWWDRLGRANAAGSASLTSLTLSPVSVVGGNANATGTITLTGPAAGSDDHLKRHPGAAVHPTVHAAARPSFTFSGHDVHGPLQHDRDDLGDLPGNRRTWRPGGQSADGGDISR